ncbi:DUF3310 domain-containing protein [Komagataeibacter europaeus]|uniref:DUF3310 domain-containing protein n=1 Tax=Komagataeibacter europaeus TaxID=33995 RepID=UPI001E41361C|nr:DUF3310 domain-containing protein [Komagataeibacter europaeus]
MTETHTPYQRGRRAAERGAPRECPVGMFSVDGAFEWFKGYDSVPVMDRSMGLIGAAQAPASTVNHPRHYNAHPSGIECIQVVEHMSFNLGNALKYIWRADEKGNALEDLKKAEWYIKREIARREAA